ncbi:S8 family serine peptidase [Streptomyces sp. NBC_00154]|uniref:S8 family serine peptidase n=1 Tax=Streptomyces sp. NBC_00154 TaxID=2975670 RepID=UPI002253108F|nr:S8 family serine peptidase [Streptomyces sp. NBC_00154]MCX5316530.1 S8 family serine peptidase [Streptomyces sp. NBC_00154]
MSPSRRRGLTAAVAALMVLTATGPAASADAAATPPSPTATAAAGPAIVRTVTLITGDKVTVTANGGRHSVTSVTDPQGRTGGAHVMSVGDDIYVYPDVALPFIASGALDEHLFNVTELLADGYDDARSDHLPLIVTYTDAAARSRALKTPEGASRTLTLSSIQGAAISAKHTRAADFWSSLTGAGRAFTGARSAGSAPAALAGGVAKVWLDGKVKATLSDTTAQIGAPEVWAGGDTGQSVDVAVLDTGIDAAHPDFAGRIVATESFVPGQDVTDRQGHGTHVASTVAGTGAASGGKEKGVAPGAGLHIGKVLDNDGSGQDSWILAGMEWAARDQHAKVVSMSLGGGPTDGTDPLSQAVNRLSEETGTLFVIAAGNSGPEAYSVSAPGAADAALTVGAVNGPGKGVDQLASFSSRGPRVGDNAIKPDLTAPGVNVLAARSQYAAEGEGAYQTMSGTSMATPHVAGAAALLAAKHPDWTGQQLKDALVSTTASTQRFSPFEAGSGRLDIAAAVKATLFASGSAFAQAHYPYTPSQTVRKDVTYTNTGSEPVTVDLSLSQDQLPEGVFTLTDSRLTVPARGTATVGVITHLDAAEDNAAYSSRLTATRADGTVLTRTPVGVNKEGRRVTLSVTAKDRHGDALPGTLVLKDVERNTAPKMYEVDASGRMSLRLPPSTYSAWMNTAVPGIDGTHTLGFAMFSAPQIDLDADRTVRFDAANLRKAAAYTPQPTANQFMRVDQYRTNGDLFPFMDSYMPESWLYDSLWVTPTPKVTKGSYTFATRWRQVQPALTFSSGSQTYAGVVIQSLSPALPEGTGSYRAVWAGNGSAADFRKLKARGQVAVVRRSDTVPAPDQAAAAAKAGARQLLILNDGYGKYDPWADLPDAAPLPVASLGTDDSARLLSRIRKPGTATLKVVSHPHPRYLYDLVRHHDGAIPHDPSYRPGPGELARIEEEFRDTKQGEAREYRDDVSAIFNGPMLSDSTPVATQGTLTSWVTAGTGVRWVSGAGMSDLGQRGLARSYKPRSTTGESWFSPIQRPRLLNDGISWRAPFRTGDVISTSAVPAWGDAGGHAGVVWADSDTSKISLYQGDQLLGEDVNERIVTVEGMSPDALPYRMVVEGKRNLPDRPYSIRTRTEWGFTSSTTDYTVLTPLPLVQLDYAVATNLAGKAHRRTGLTVSPSHLKGAAGTGEIRTVTLEVSYDDGATWHRTTLRQSGGDWKTQLDAPSRARFASLRTTARDTKGNSVIQTVIRAFGLK